MAKKIEEKYKELSDISDDDIKNYYEDYINTHIKTSRVILDMPINLKEYLKNRFKFTNTILESLYCVINNIYVQPTCKICNKPVKFYNISTGYSIYCSTKCSMNDKDIINKLHNTFLEKYSVDWYSKSNEYIEKIHNTCLNKYGENHFTKTEQYKDNIKKINNEKYGCDWGFQSDIIKDKIKQTCISKYNCENISQNKQISIRKSIKMSSLESQKKHKETLKRNNTFNKSKPEEECYNILKKKFPYIIRQYKDIRYPFNCDFYIPSIDLFIEYNGSQFHHRHEFDNNNIDDINELNKLKEKSTGKNQYSNIIKTWTINDPYKRLVAKQNNLNYIEFWNINEVKTWINNYEQEN